MFDNLEFTQVLILGLIGLLFFREEIMPFIKAKLGIKQNGNAPATKKELEKLTQYVNHRQTEHGEEVISTLKEINEGIKDINRKHEEYEKYGIRVRE